MTRYGHCRRSTKQQVNSILGLPSSHYTAAFTTSDVFHDERNSCDMMKIIEERAIKIKR